MLEITQGAAEALQRLRGQAGLDEAPARVQAHDEGDQAHRLAISFDDPPRDGDAKVWDRGGLEVYVAGELVAPLSDTILEVRRTGGRLELALRDQDPLAHAGHGPGEHHHPAPGPERDEGPPDT